MLDLDTRAAILKLCQQGHGIKTVARWLGVSKNSVKKVLRNNSSDVPPFQRTESLEPHLEDVRTLHSECKGNLVRVHEKLNDAGVIVPYATLTGFCRRHHIGVQPKRRPGNYHFAPGEEMQHDTSPHQVEVGGRTELLQCASLVLCYSRKQFAQCYRRWSRFEARVFFTEALQWMGGSAARCLLDNSTVIVTGVGKEAVATPEMKALADLFDFEFVAYELGDKDRAGRVERGHHYVENNFYVGRQFTDLNDLNTQLRAWCDRNTHRLRKRLGATPVELFVAEEPCLKPLPRYIPEVYALHSRRADIEGYVNLHTNRYSVDADLIGVDFEVREQSDTIRIFRGHKLVAVHEKQTYGARQKKTLPEHKSQCRRRRKQQTPTPTEQMLRSQGPEVCTLIDALHKRYGGRANKAIRRLHRLWSDYPTEPVRKAISVALDHGLLDLERIDQMVLRLIAGDFFRLPITHEGSNNEG